MSSPSHHEDRLTDEITLLLSIYPEEVNYTAHSREIHYKIDNSTLILRIPSGYPEKEKPEVLVAGTDGISHEHRDVRDVIKSIISEQAEGEECLDAIISAFNDLLFFPDDDSSTHSSSTSPMPTTPQTKKTVVIYLHHLLALSKRKTILAPDDEISGISKPGYPGVLVFSGPVCAINRHVQALRVLNWQAFQVRYEEDVEWKFGGGESGVREVETLGEVMVAVGERKGDLMEALRMK